MRVLVCGGRDFSSVKRVFEVLRAIDERAEVQEIIHGGAPGADSLAHKWALKQQVRKITVFPARWKDYGNSAGPIRNGLMLSQLPNLVIAFPGGAGTANMVALARANGHQVIEVTADGELPAEIQNLEAPRPARERA